MRRLLSIFLLLAFGLPGVTPLFALSSGTEGNLPVCCRRAGVHQCASSIAERPASQTPGVSAVKMRCPFCPSTAAGGSHTLSVLLPSRQLGLTNIATHPAGVAQTQSRLRLAEMRSRGMRGPPKSLSL